MSASVFENIRSGDIRALARAISVAENDPDAVISFLSQNTPPQKKIIGITGPPGAGKSTLTDALIGEIIHAGESVAVLCVDPSSPFHHGALLGDRIRMSDWYNHPKVFIRSLATRGSLGGLHPQIQEICELIKYSAFDHIILETVGVGQSEVEIAGLADTTVVVLVPEAGDEVQTMKSGVMEIADIFVVNKSDRPEADLFVKNLRQMLAPSFSTNHAIPVLKTVASQKQGTEELYRTICSQQKNLHAEHRAWLLTQKALYLIQKQRMKDVDAEQIKTFIEEHLQSNDFNLYNYIQRFMR